MNAVVGDILPLAVAAGLSPIPLIAVVLIMMSPRPRASGSAFAAGWILGCALVVAIGGFAAGLLRSADGEGTPVIASWARIAFGVVLLFMAARKVRKSRRSKPELPVWMSGLMSASPARALGLGLLLSAANPKNALLGVAAGISIGAAGLVGGPAVAAGSVYVVLAAAAVLGIVLAAIIAPKRMAAVLAPLRDWLTLHNSAIMTLLLVVFAFVLIGRGIEGL